MLINCCYMDKATMSFMWLCGEDNGTFKAMLLISRGWRAYLWNGLPVVRMCTLA